MKRFIYLMKLIGTLMVEIFWESKLKVNAKLYVDIYHSSTI